MLNNEKDWKGLGVLKYIVGGILILVGIMGGLDSFVIIWKSRGNAVIGISPVTYQLWWMIGNGALLLLGILYIQQGKILTQKVHLGADVVKYKVSLQRSNLLILITLAISLVIIVMAYLSAKELVEFISRYIN